MSELQWDALYRYLPEIELGEGSTLGTDRNGQSRTLLRIFQLILQFQHLALHNTSALQLTNRPALLPSFYRTAIG